MKSIKEQAITLRKEGYSYRYISKELDTSLSTLSYWLTPISYTPNKHTLNTISLARINAARTKNSKKQKSIQEAKEIAHVDIGTISKRDLLMLGLGIYIGEGTKANDEVRLVNGDPWVIRVMIQWFKKIYSVSEKHFRARIHMYPDNDERKAVIFWCQKTGLSKSCFQKTQIDRRTNKTKNKIGKLPFGTLHLTIRGNGKKEFGALLARKIMARINYVLNMRV